MSQLSSHHVLIAEGQAIIAMDLESALRDAGFECVTIATSCKQADELIAMRMPNVAVLDVDLLDGPCDRLATLLHEQGVPFLVFSSRTDASAVDPIFSKGSWLRKPAPTDTIVSAVAELLAR